MNEEDDGNSTERNPPVEFSDEDAWSEDTEFDSDSVEEACPVVRVLDGNLGDGLAQQQPAASSNNTGKL